MGVRTWVQRWPVYRQLAGEDRLGLGAASKSAGTEALRPRVATADEVVKSICPYCAVGCGQNAYVHDGGDLADEHRHLARLVVRPGSHRGVVDRRAGLFPKVGRLATATAAVAGPGVASYTAVLIADTAMPAWHDAHRELPLVFVGSATCAAAGLGLLGAARSAGQLMKAAEALAIGGAVVGASFGGRSHAAAGVAGVALLTGSAWTRFGVFRAGVASAQDPRYTVEPQRARLDAAVAR